MNVDRFTCVFNCISQTYKNLTTENYVLNNHLFPPYFFVLRRKLLNTLLHFLSNFINL